MRVDHRVLAATVSPPIRAVSEPCSPNPLGISSFRNGCHLAPTVADWRKTSTGGQYGALYTTRVIRKSRQETCNTASRKNTTQQTGHTTSNSKKAQRQTKGGRTRQFVDCNLAARSLFVGERLLERIRQNVCHCETESQRRQPAVGTDLDGSRCNIHAGAKPAACEKEVT